MIEQSASPSGISDALARTRTRRIRTFIIILATLDVPFLVLGLLDLRSSPLTLLLVLASYIYYGLYYMLLRAGYGVPATYVCVALISLLLGPGLHNGGGALSAASSLYFLLLVGVALVLDDPRAVDVTMIFCLISYLGLALYEFYIAPPAAPAFQVLYNTASPLLINSILVGMLASLVGCWLVMRSTSAGIRRTTLALEQARAKAEASAAENAALAAQVQAGNDSLLATQAQLRGTIDALTLPLIPLDGSVALLPLVGYLDDIRAGQLVEGLLRSIYEQRVRKVIIDITGLREADTGVATALLHATRSARLLGAQVVLSGVSPRAAEALVGLGADLRGLRTAGNLGTALRLIEDEPPSGRPTTDDRRPITDQRPTTNDQRPTMNDYRPPTTDH